ncbi:MAG: ABC transporter substrate-binding protein, partial [Methanogenium sp.]|nr:ABC transporter substrate-binding protein [Methanogenium sp.]
LFGQAAERYEVSADNTEWTFYIKDDLYWSDGKKVTPEDVQFTFTYLGDNIPSAGWIHDTLASTSVTENSVTFVFNQPYTTINLEFATYNLVPKHIWEEIEDPNEYTDNGPYVGCGPYYLDSIDINAAKLVFKKNPHWRGKSPSFGNIEVHWFANEDAACLALEGGEVDTYYRYAKSYPYPNIQRIIDTGNFNTIEKTSIGLTFMGINLKREPLSDQNFRNALTYAIDYDEITRIDTLGYGVVPNRGFVPPGMDYYKETDKITYNTTKAREILNNSGYTDIDDNGIFEGTDGNDICLELLIRTGYERDGELIKDYLEQAGIGVSVKQVDTTTWFDLKDNYEYDLTVSGTTPWGMLMHAGWGTGYFDSRRTGKGVLHNLDDPVFIELCDNILATTSQEKLEQYASDLQDYYATEIPAIPLYWKTDVTPYNRDFTGWHYNPLFGIYNLDTFLNVRYA